MSAIADDSNETNCWEIAMSHHHHHDHGNDASGTMSLPEKLEKILDHWVQHNQSHTDTYRQWAADAKANGLEEVAALLTQAADQTDAVSALFNDAQKAVSELKAG